MIPLRCALLAGLLVAATASACGGNGASQAGERLPESSAAPAVPPLSPVSVGSNSPGSTDASPAVTTPPGSTLPGSTLPAATAAGSTIVATPAAAVLPAVEVTDVATGAKYSLASLVATDRPTLFWMWAPH